MSMEQKIRDVALPLIHAAGMDLFDLELAGRTGKGGGRRTLRLFLDKEGGVTIDDCALISHQVGMALEAEEVIDGAYVLEVSSPGLTRPLKTPDHFRRSVGKLVQVKLKGTAPLTKETGGKMIGIIEAVDDGGVTLFIRETEARHLVPFDDVAHAQLELEF
ncbi:MAG: ribosome maturation factor RimP [Nitrospinae bacterium]|nr:ribosome maturation factor RimP [Nitrospinota bacterium]